MWPSDYSRFGFNSGEEEAMILNCALTSAKYPVIYRSRVIKTIPVFQEFIRFLFNVESTEKITALNPNIIVKHPWKWRDIPCRVLNPIHTNPHPFLCHCLS